eukprot:CAMPEP_0117045108 /NCGR_PEP_ID=MMETSP0472-20121206/31218_1 /TAXON_ID=693140 ORGANISM="Tiarina fusus, Strain LIS" /NCGR_SAMPLE_ID=MMETSP0472 /ASSEMBLY_ACC=CAM_ASM_000603 /LENGTH=292 /DNA_ID=CAMNT_0004757007 /DNA_START=41 /DNA_END=919 /DNA_ORIENTATION=-
MDAQATNKQVDQTEFVQMTDEEAMYQEEAMIMEKRGRRLRRAALTAGIFQAISIVCIMYTAITVRWVLIEWNQPERTAYEIGNSIGLFKMGIVADTTMVISETFVGVLLGLILIGAGVNPATSSLIITFKVVATAIMGANVIFMIAAGLLLDENLPIYKTVSQYFYSDYQPPIGTQLAYLMLLINKYGLTFAQVFSGVHLGLLGFTIVMWGVFPRWMGYTILLAGPMLILNSFLIFVMPGYDGAISFFFMIPYFVGTIWLAGWCLVNTPHPSKNREFGSYPQEDQVLEPQQE